MQQKRILVVDDEPDLCDILLFNLRAGGYEADACYSAEEALERIGLGSQHDETPERQALAYDLLLLDVMMPGMSGFELAARLKADGRTPMLPIIFLTAKDTEDDTLQGFAIGADDYVAKPFSVREVLARMKAVLSRSQVQAGAADLSRGSHAQSGGAAANLSYKGLAIDAVGKTVTTDGATVALTRTEYDLLHLLLANAGRLFSRQELLSRVWPQDVIVTERTVDVNIARLRKKLGAYGSCLISRTGFGYGFDK